MRLLVALTALILLSLTSYSQVVYKYTNYNVYGWQVPRLKSTIALIPPIIDSSIADKDIGNIIKLPSDTLLHKSTIYQWTGVKWESFTESLFSQADVDHWNSAYFASNIIYNNYTPHTEFLDSIGIIKGLIASLGVGGGTVDAVLGNSTNAIQNAAVNSAINALKNSKVDSIKTINAHLARVYANGYVVDSLVYASAVDSVKVTGGNLVTYYSNGTTTTQALPSGGGGGGSGTVTNVTATGPISVTGTSTITPNITIAQANGSANGYLSSSDWTTFNNKQAAGSYLTSYTETDPVFLAHVANTVTGTNISNWNTAFSWGNHAGLYPLLAGSYANPTWISSLAWSKITGTPTTLLGYGITDAYPLSGNPSNFLTANQPVTVTATGDATGTSSASPTTPSIPLTLANVNSTTGTFGSSSLVPVVTVNAKGLVTSVTTAAVSGGGGGSQTFQQVLTTGSTLTQNNTISQSAYKLSITGTTSPDTLTINVNTRDSLQSSIFNGTSITAQRSSTNNARGFSSIVAPGLNTTEVNNGVVGATLSTLISAFSNIPTRTSTIKYLFFEYGTNELLNGIDTTTYKTNYKRVLDTAIARGYTLPMMYFMSNAYVDTIINPTKTYTSQLNMFNACKNFCIANGLNFIDIFNVGLNNANGNYFNPFSDVTKVHPGDEGHSMLARAIITAVNPAVIKKTQLLAVNGNAELQNLTLPLAENAVDSTTIPLGYDWKKKKVVPLPAGYFVRSTGTLNPQNSPISTDGDIYTRRGMLVVGGQVNTTNKNKIRGFQLYYDSTTNDGFLFPYNNNTSTAGNVFVGNGKLGVGVTSFSTAAGTGTKILTNGAIQGLSYTATGSPVVTTGTASAAFGVLSGNAYIFGTSAAGARIPITLEPIVIVNGSTNVSGTNLQVVGSGYFSTKLRIGSTVAPAAALHITPSAVGQNGADGFLISEPDAAIQDNASGVGTRPIVAVNSLGITTLSSTNVQTYTTAQTLRIAGAPVASTNVTIGTAAALVVETGNTGMGTTAPAATSILDLTSTAKGLLLPRMTLAQMNAISSPAAGLLVMVSDYDNVIHKYSSARTRWEAQSKLYLTTTQRTGLTAYTGLEVYDTDLSNIYYWNGSTWVQM